MRRALLVVGLLLVSAMSMSAEPPDTPELRRQAAERYMRTTDFAALMDAALQAGSQSLPEDKRAEFIALAKKHVRYDALEALTLAAMIKNFTAQELNALANFYGSPEGRSAMAKFGTYMADVVPLLQTEMAHAMAQMQAEVEAGKVGNSGT